MDVSGVQRVDRPTRDVLVVFDDEGDRRFVGFGGPNGSFADAQIAADALPMELLARASALVTGTLGLNFPATAAAMHKAVDAAKAGSAVVREPVFMHHNRLIHAASLHPHQARHWNSAIGHRRQVLVDINWRPVFWEDPEAAPGVIKPYVAKADIVKLSDEEAEWLFGLPAAEALAHPEKVTAASAPALTLAALRHHGCACRSTDMPAAAAVSSTLEWTRGRGIRCMHALRRRCWRASQG